MSTYRIHHKTSYAYQFPVTVSHHCARLKPVDSDAQSCSSFRLQIEPASSDLVERLDYYGNTVHLFSIQEPHDALVVETFSQVDTHAQAVELQELDTPISELQAAFADPARNDLIDAKQFLYETELTPKTDEIVAFGQRFLDPDRPIGPALAELLLAFKEAFEFDAEATDIYTPVQTTLQTKRGVCQDFAHLMLSVLRAHGLSACYASGYILTNPPPGKPRLAGADASHAWTSVFIPSHGWIDLDPTNNLVCADQHIRVAYGRDFAEISMLSGAINGGGDHTVNVAVTMEPLE